MSSVVFVGPTLPADVVTRMLPSARPTAPAACGDIYRAARDGADTIVIIDGYFDQQLSVWHKEILWALSRGARVYGAASMGALRAAELHPFGMVGVGRIFDWYVSGAIEADDEVAIVHENAARGFRPVSDAMVNLRATFLLAASAGAISSETCSRLIEVGRSMFYPTRNLRGVLAQAAGSGVGIAELSRLRDHLGANPAHFVDLKRADAIAAIERVRADASARGARDERPCFDFEYTEAWHELTRQFSSEAANVVRDDSAKARVAESEPNDASDAWIEDVMRVLEARAPELAARLMREAERRAALLECAVRSGVEVTVAEMQAVSDELRRDRKLLSPTSTKRWLAERGLDVTELSAWMQEEVLVARASRLRAGAIGKQLRRVLHASLEPEILSLVGPLASESESRYHPNGVTKS